MQGCSRLYFHEERIFCRLARWILSQWQQNTKLARSLCKESKKLFLCPGSTRKVSQDPLPTISNRDFLQSVKDIAESEVRKLAICCTISVGRLSSLESLVGDGLLFVSGVAAFVKGLESLKPLLSRRCDSWEKTQSILVLS